jgi:hypothetical protein
MIANPFPPLPCCHSERSGAKNLALDFSAGKQQGEMLRCAQHDMSIDHEQLTTDNCFPAYLSFFLNSALARATMPTAKIVNSTASTVKISSPTPFIDFRIKNGTTA